jgi:DNA-binding NarL/FixJ family response regulator
MVSDSGSILVIDDHPRIRTGLVRLVEELGHTAVEADTLESGLEQLERTSFRLVLLDLLLPGMHGFDGLRVIHERYSDTPVVIVSGTATVELAVACMKRGARDVIPKPFDPDVALELIRAALEPTSATYVRNESRPGRARDAVQRATNCWSLSPRQSEVLELLVTGASNRTIADSLKCAESTVEMHVTTLLKKSTTAQRAELVARFWMDFGT